MRNAGGVLAALVLAVAGVGLGSHGPGGGTAQAQLQSSPCSGIGITAVSLTSTVPTEFLPIGGQLGADCMAWQSFIALNWAADPDHPGQPDRNAPASAFGTPGDTAPVVWESYLEASAVFNPVGKPLATWKAARPAVKELAQVSKFGATDLSLSSITQAGDGKWLTSQAGGLAYYEVRINQDEFEFITTNVFDGSDLTTYAGQAACAGQVGRGGKGGFNLPGGGGTNPTAKLDTDCLGNPAIYGQNQGAIEIKASWIALPADHSLDGRYKTAAARITDPFGRVSQATVGLVGLHILHKTPNAPQFVWATFEQIDNSPDDAGAGFKAPTLPANPNRQPRSTYAFFNPNCTATSDPTYECQHNRPPGTPCDAAGQPPGCSPYASPMQITRIVPVDSIADRVTGYVWSLLASRSVFNYYRLANVQWPNSPVAVAPGSTTPLPTGDITPPDTAGIVANTTLETFQQTNHSCMDCHQYAEIAHPSQHTLSRVAGQTVRKARSLAKSGVASKPYASGYSFVFQSETVK